MQPMIFVTVVLVVTLLCFGCVLLVMSAQEKKRRSRIQSVIRGNTVVDKRSAATAEKDKRVADISRKLKETTEENKAKRNSLSSRLMQAGLSISQKQFWIYSVLFAVVATILTKLSGQSALVTILVGITAFLGVPRYWLKRRIKKRQAKFLHDFADALEAMVRLLKAGMPVTEAINMASKEFEGPVGEEMAMIYDSQRVGISLPEASLEAARRMPITEMQMFATAMAIQAQTGASLSEILTNLAKVIRARFRLKRKVEALSSEAKASAMIIGSLPFLVGGGMYFINNDYMMVMFTTLTGKMLLAGCAAFMLMGIMVMKAMINFKV
ncbi:type II secretion system F family protein [Micavibrio aeruginosavorus]|uniref:Flp pilus assembly protein TadB n=1 Tax=Micavibrio aeruginosavorus EPB TaxID=349215 RepID=M4VD73_9BACT|nr:type II secretion system F family protein [Micavibrio aeruginosavorus]AGH97347.1 Flp pilus assembly protein TadB [Micavibrio aeruginosavorus EPB]